MQDKILSVFYGEDRLPYKDAQRTVHYPIANGDLFCGANNTTQIRFYVDQIGGTTNVQWVATSKLPNGQIGNKVLSNPKLDDELGEHYLELDLSSYYTSIKGDVYIALNGYQGGVNIEEDEDTGIWSISGTPTIQATGSIKIGVNYAPQTIPGTHFGVSDLQQILGALSDKISQINGIVVLNNIATEDLSGYELGQIFFDRETYCFYRKAGLGYFDVTIPNLVTLNNTSGTLTATQLAIVKKPDALILTSNGLCRKLSTGDDILQIFISTPVIGENSSNLSILNYVVVSIFNGNYSITTNTYNFYSKDQVDNLLANNYYTKTESDNRYDIQSLVSLGSGSSGTLSSANLEKVQRPNAVILKNYNFYYRIWSQTNSLTFESRYIVGMGSTQRLEIGKIVIDRTTGAWTYSNTSSFSVYTTSGVDNIVSTLKANSFQVVASLPATGQEGIIYLVETSSGVYEQYIWEGSDYIDLGSTQIDLSNYYTKDEADNKFATITYVDTELDTKQDTLVSGTNIKTLNGTSLLGSGNYAFDDEFDEESTNALQNQVISKEIRELNYELAIIREELFEVLLTELDYKVSYAMNYVVPDSLSDSDGTHRLVYSETMLKEVEGNGVALNQGFDLTGDNRTDYCSYTRDTTNHSFKLKITTSASLNRIRLAYYKGVLSRKYFICFNGRYTNKDESSSLTIDCDTGNSYNIVSSALTTNYVQYSKIWTCDYNGVFTIGIRGTRAVNDEVELQNFCIFDLTQMFGAGNEPTTTSDIRVQWLLSLGYVPYNTGSLENTTISGIKLIGFNKWNEEWEIGSISTSTGDNETNNERIRSKNFIKVIPGQTYTTEFPNSVGTFNRLYFYDANKSFIGYQNINIGVQNITLSNDCYFVRFILTENYGTTYKNDVAFHLTGTRTGYAPYTETTISLPQTTLLGAFNSHDTLSVVEGNVVEGEQLYNIVKTTNVGTYIFTGNETWSKAGSQTTSGKYRYYFEVVNMKSGLGINGISSKFITIDISQTSYQYAPDNTVLFGLSNRYLQYFSSTELTVSQVKYLFAGSTINFELVTPTQTIVAQDLHFDQVSSVIEQGGTIEPIFEDVPPNITTTFVVKKAVGE